MKYVKLTQDFQVDRVKNPTTPPDRELTLDWIANAVGYGYKQGLRKDDRRLFASVIRKLEDTKKTTAEYLEINPVEEVFIKNAFNQLVCSPQEAVWINLAEDAVLAAVSELPANPSAPVNGPTTSTPGVSAGAK